MGNCYPCNYFHPSEPPQKIEELPQIPVHTFTLQNSALLLTWSSLIDNNINIEASPSPNYTIQFEISAHD